MCPLYGDVYFIDSPSKNQNTSKVNIKSTICHDFSSPGLLEGPKTERLKKMQSFFIQKTSNKIHDISRVNY